MTTIVIEGGRVLRPDHSIVEGDVLVDRETGTIEAVGRVDGGDERLDADGGLVMPGLVNAHCHVAMTLMRGYADDKPLDRWLREDIWPVEAALEPADVRAGALLGLAEMIASGTTAFADMYFHVPAIAEAVEAAGLRARLGHGVITVGKDEEAAWDDLEEGIEVAERLDGVADGRITTGIMPHSLTTVGEAYFREAADAARQLGIPLHYHANETTDEVAPIRDERGVAPLDYAAELEALHEGDFVAHAVHVGEEEIERLAGTGAAVAHCPASNMKLASGMAPVQRLLDAGIPVGIGTDGPASNNDLDMFDELRDAAMIGKLAADDPSAVDADTAVAMATTGGARTIGLPVGRLEVGAPADLIVVDLSSPRFTPAHDLVSHLAYAATGADVRHTMCDGRVLMRDGELLTLDVDRVRAEAQRRADELVARAEGS